MTRTSDKKEEKLSHAKPQEVLPPISISFKELFAERHRYRMAIYQRKIVWNLRQKQQFIDTLFLGDPFPPIEGYEGFDENGAKIWEIGDGQNRLDAILSFMLGEFKTWTAPQKRAKEPSSNVGPVQPGKYFEELDTIAKNYFLDYHMRIDRLRDRPESEKFTRFLRVQNHVPLSAAERLRGYPSKAKEGARLIEQHQFWEDFYEGKSNRGQLFQSSLYLLAIEMTPKSIVDLQGGGFIQGLISGKHDEKITDTLVNATITRLDIASHLFAGTHFTVRAASIAMYQAVMFLEQAGYIIQVRDQGKLTKWIHGIIDESTRPSGTPSYARPLQHLTGAKAQQEFWKKHLPTIMSLFEMKRLTHV